MLPRRLDLVVRSDARYSNAKTDPGLAERAPEEGCSYPDTHTPTDSNDLALGHASERKGICKKKREKGFLSSKTRMENETSGRQPIRLSTLTGRRESERH
jgi:hypothetical protein